MRTKHLLFKPSMPNWGIEWMRKKREADLIYGHEERNSREKTFIHFEHEAIYNWTHSLNRNTKMTSQ